MLAPLAAIDDLTDKTTAQADELVLGGVLAAALGLIRGPLAVIFAIAI